MRPEHRSSSLRPYLSSSLLLSSSLFRMAGAGARRESHLLMASICATRLQLSISPRCLWFFVVTRTTGAQRGRHAINYVLGGEGEEPGGHVAVGAPGL